MVSSRAPRRGQSRQNFLIQKPNGDLSPRVQAVGPDHFGILAVDCAKARSRYLLADFFGRILLEPATLPHARGGFQAAIDRVRQAVHQHALADLVVAIERTGDYHRPVQIAFRSAGFETRLVHPFTAKQYRQPADPGNKTDDTDLGGIFRAATQGFGLLEPVWPDLYRSIQLLRRHRRDLVDKTSLLRCQIREALHAAMPGYAEAFSHLFETPGPLQLARRTMSAQTVLKLGILGLARLADEAKLNCRRDTFAKIFAWVKVAKTFSRIAHAMVTGGQLFPHPCCQQRHYILDKLLQFHHEHRSDWPARQRDLETVTAQLSPKTCAEEAEPLRRQLEELANRRRGPQPLAGLIPLVLARLQARMVQSTPHEGAGP
jgi:Transposase